MKLTGTLFIIFALTFGFSAISLAQSDPCVLYDGDSTAKLNTAIALGCPVITTDVDSHIHIASTSEILIPEETSLIFHPGSTWTIYAGSVVRVYGDFTVHNGRAEVFKEYGRIVREFKKDALGCPLDQDEVYPEWFGAQPNDMTDDSNAITRALDFGGLVSLNHGNYMIQNRIWLLGSQSLSGQGRYVGPNNGTQLTQTANFNFVRYFDGLPLDEQPYPWKQVLHSDFVIGLDSDCAKINDLTINGSDVTDAIMGSVRASSDHYAHTLSNGIQISTAFRWHQINDQRPPGTPIINEPIRNVEISNVQILNPATACIQIFSSTGVSGVDINDVHCEARTTELLQDGFNMEVFHPDPAFGFVHENVTIRNSTFVGGRHTTFRVAGGKNIRIYDSVFYGKSNNTEGTEYVASFYTSDNGTPVSVEIWDSSFIHLEPASNVKGVINLVGRALRQDVNNFFPFLEAPGEGTMIQFNRSHIEGHTEFPLVVDQLGFSEPVVFRGVTFKGGLHGVVADRNLMEIVLDSLDANGSLVREIRPITINEMNQYNVSSSNFHLVAYVEPNTNAIRFTRFEGQVDSSLKLSNSEVIVSDVTFSEVGILNSPVISYGSPSHSNPGAYNSIFSANSFYCNNSSSLIHATGSSPGTVFTNNYNGCSVPTITSDLPSFLSGWQVQ